MKAGPRLLLALCACCLQSCRATVILQSGNFTASFSDLPADFGPDIPQEGVTGLLLVADPIDACTELTPPASIKAPWVALIARSQDKAGCTFDTKVAHAEATGAIAAIIFDDVLEPLVLMAKDPRHPDPLIPAVFVSRRSGLMMKRLIEEGKTVVTLLPLNEQLWLSMLMSACAGFLAVNVVLGALWMVRRQRGGMMPGGGAAGYGPLQPQGMSVEEIRRLPIVIYEEPAAAGSHLPSSGAGAAAGGTGSGPGGASLESSSSSVRGVLEEEAPAAAGYAGGTGGGGGGRDDDDSGSESGRKGGGTRHTCAICLEGYCHGEKLRVLPCQHRYHSECVDTWLANRHPICPVCKADAHARDSDSDLEAGGSGGARRLRRWHPLLLGRLGAGWFALRSRVGRGGGSGQAAAPTSAAAGLAAGGGGEPAEQQQLLLAGADSRPGSPVSPASPPLRRQAQMTAASLTSRASSAARLPSRLPEILPADSSTSASVAPGQQGGLSPRRQASQPQPCPSPGWHSSPRGSSGAHFASPSPASPSQAGSSGVPVQHAEPDSTEGSETESEAE